MTQKGTPKFKSGWIENPNARAKRRRKLRAEFPTATYAELLKTAKERGFTIDDNSARDPETGKRVSTVTPSDKKTWMDKNNQKVRGYREAWKTSNPTAEILQKQGMDKSSTGGINPLLARIKEAGIVPISKPEPYEKPDLPGNMWRSAGLRIDDSPQFEPYLKTRSNNAPPAAGLGLAKHVNVDDSQISEEPDQHYLLSHNGKLVAVGGNIDTHTAFQHLAQHVNGMVGNLEGDPKVIGTDQFQFVVHGGGKAMRGTIHIGGGNNPNKAGRLRTIAFRHE
jgi:hypothetical protein